jgi:nicotinate-nucleotide pyrophosphorylase (carboxylating)
VELNTPEVEALIALALQEDVRTGDITGQATIPADRRCSAVILAKAPGVVAGVEVVRSVFRALDPDVHVEILVADGTPIVPPLDLITLEGPARSVLAGERTALNILGRMCGIATLTRTYVEAIAGTGARILDTRKTMPGMRILDKYAVACGGGVNHRMGLYDAFLIKDNHLQVAGGVTAAVALARAAHPDRSITVEVEDLAQLREAVSCHTERIMLDNMSTDLMREAVAIVDGRAEVEASGGITLDTIREVALTGVDVISVGALTHSAKWLDVSMEVS